MSNECSLCFQNLRKKKEKKKQSRGYLGTLTIYWAGACHSQSLWGLLLAIAKCFQQELKMLEIPCWAHWMLSNLRGLAHRPQDLKGPPQHGSGLAHSWQSNYKVTAGLPRVWLQHLEKEEGWIFASELNSSKLYFWVRLTATGCAEEKKLV